MKEQLRQLTDAVLNHTDVREFLRDIPAIGSLESLGEQGILADLRLTSMSTPRISSMNLFVLDYESRASDKRIYPNVRARLIELGVAERHDIRADGTTNKGNSDEYEEVRLHLHGAKLQVQLRVYNPDYKR